MNWIRSLSLILFCLILYTLTASANREEREEDWENGMIHIPRKTSFFEGESTGKLSVSTSLEGKIESLDINPEKKQSILLQKGQNPIELEREFQPSLPWRLHQGQFNQFIAAHTFFLKQFDDGTCKV